MILLASADFFQNSFSKSSFRNTIKVSNGLVQDQDQQNVCPDLDPNCLQRLSEDVKVAASKETVNSNLISRAISSNFGKRPLAKIGKK